ncbi:MAG: insulinase family protein [Deltaproteobacteria bacterium]|nr:insulinase family protein [Deltaproteobacteria bacterium]
MMKLVNTHAFGPRLAVSKHVLENGLKVLLLPDRFAPVACLQLWYGVGSRDERPGKTGIAHLFEHLMFNQTSSLAPGEFDRRMEEAGGETNAGTWIDWTYYRDNLPAQSLGLALSLEAERMQHLVLGETQVETEREVVANERRFRVDDDVEGFLSEQLFKMAFQVHAYGSPIIGWMDDILALTTSDCREFYKTYYAPNNATLVVVGDVDPAPTLELVSRHFGSIPPSTLPTRQLSTEPPQVHERRATFAKPVGADRAVLGYKAPSQADPDWIPLKLTHELLAGGNSSRLHRRLIVEKEIVSTIRGFLLPSCDPGVLQLYLTMKPGHQAAEALEVIDEELERLHKEPPTPDEMSRARNRLETEFWSDLETAEEKAETLGHYETTSGDYRTLFQVAQAVPRVNADDVVRVARRFLGHEQRTVVLATPQGDEVSP